MEYKLTLAAYRQALKDNKFLGLKCNQCGAYTAPPKKVCSECASEDMQIVELSGKGEIQTFTVMWVAPESYTAPYIICIIKLDEGPQVMANIVGTDPAKAGMELMGQRVKWQGLREIPPDRFNPGGRMALVFELVN
jgi:uncharacterized OB-fold protein